MNIIQKSAGAIKKLPGIIKANIHLNKKSILLCLVTAAVLSAGVIWVFHDYQNYTAPIAKITKAVNAPSEKSKENSAGEKYYDQALTGVLLNGSHKGSQISMQNQYSQSGVYDDEYKAGDEVFVQLDPVSGDKLTGTVTGLKRDKYIAVLSALFILLIILVIGKRGFMPILSLLANIAVFWYALDLYAGGRNILFLSNCLVLFFTFVSLLFIGGINRKTFAAILSTLVSIAVTMLIFKIVMYFTDGVDYAFMEYIASPNDLPEIFMSQILLGGLGAVMDVAITEAATINELIAKDRDISLKELIKSGREVGHDIMGTMINIMLFTYVSGSIPLIILKMKSDIRLHTIVLWHMPMELYRFLVGSIGILLSIPISLFIAVFLFKKWRRLA
jgi:Predicted multitransmembrane protein